MSRINVHSSTRRVGGFTLVEIMVATTLLGVVFAGVLAAYVFLGRNLTRLVNLQQQEVESRRTLRTFTQDLSAAIDLSTATSASVVFRKPVSSGIATVSYVYSSGAGTLVRTEPYPGGASQTLLRGLTSFAISYYSEAGTAVSDSPVSVKAMEIAFTTSVGTSASGTAAQYKSVSPRVLLRNKTALQ